MENKNLIGGIVSLAVVVICVATIMMPVLNDVTTTEKTFTNEGLFNYGIFDTTDTYTLEYDLSTNTLEVNGTEIAWMSGETSNNSYTIISTDNALIRWGYNTSGYYLLQGIGINSGDSTFRYYISTLTATITDGALVLTGTNTSDGAISTTIEFEEMYAIVPTEDEAVMKASTSECYIKGDSELYASGLTTVTAWSDMFHFEGTYDDGITITSPNLPGATFDNIEWNIEEVDGYEDLYKLTSIEFDITYDDTTVHATYSYFAVPTEVTAERSQHLGTAEIALIDAIPVLVIVSLVIAAVGMLVVRNRD